MNQMRIYQSAACIVVLACVAAYVNTLSGDWVWDDASSVLLHRHVQEPARFFRLFTEDQHAFGRGQGNFYRPLVSVSFMADYYLSGGPRPDASAPNMVPDVSPVLFHIANLGWHMLASLLFLALLIRVGAPRYVLLSAPLIYALHPLHTEAVAYISGRADMMSAAGIFSALFFAAGAMRMQRPMLNSFLAGVCFIGGLLSKESTMIYPVLCALLYGAVSPSEERSARADAAAASQRMRLLPLASALIILVGYLVLRATVLKFSVAEAGPSASLLQRLWETILALGMYLRLLFVPTALHMERTLTGVSPLYAGAGLVLISAIAVMAIAAWRGGQRRIVLGLGWFLAAWLPISGLFPLNAPLAEHWMYVPMAGFWWAFMEIAYGAVCEEDGRRRIYAAVLVCALLLGIMTVQRNRDWRNNETLFLATLAQNAESARVHYNLAVTYEDLHHNLAGARRHYEQFLRIREEERALRPDVPVRQDEIEVRLSLGYVYLRSQAYMEAVYMLEPLTRLAEEPALRSTAARAALQTGQAYLALGEQMQASVFFDQASRIEPQFAAETEYINAGAPFHDGY